jgi:hypothetical protein
MKKVKQIELLKSKEKLSRQKTVTQLMELKSEVEKCQRIERELEEIAKQKAVEKEKLTAYLFQSNRQLVHKVMEQREILQNRQEFLEKEQAAVTNEINKSRFKSQILEEKRKKEKEKVLEEIISKQEDMF